MKPANRSVPSADGGMGDRPISLDDLIAAERGPDGSSGCADTALVCSSAEHAVMSVDHMDYHMVMTRREVLVQLDDDLVERLDILAADLGTNRSELMRRGAQAILEAEDLAVKDRQLQAAYRRQPVDPALAKSARRIAARTAPQW
jgi:hypothetical protein